MYAKVSRKNQYDGVEEFYVTVREKGERKQEESQEEIRRKLSAVEALLPRSFILIVEIMAFDTQTQLRAET